MGQGRENVKTFLVENKDLRDRIAALVREKAGLAKPVAKAEE
jgi:cell division septum initiation protein DivIVA